MSVVPLIIIIISRDVGVRELIVDKEEAVGVEEVVVAKDRAKEAIRKAMIRTQIVAIKV